MLAVVEASTLGVACHPRRNLVDCDEWLLTYSKNVPHRDRYLRRLDEGDTKPSMSDGP